MLPSADVIRADFDRIAVSSRDQDRGIDPSAQRLVAHVPLRSRVLEIGCGTGALARELATRRGARVTAIDLSPRMIDVARVRTPASLGVEYHVADFLTLSPSGFDVVIAANTLHHLPLEETITRMADAVGDTGALLVADLFEARGLTELPYNGLSWLFRTPAARSDELAAAWDAHGLHDRLQPLRSLRRTLRALLPGVHIRRHLGWRYTAIWHRG
jgi:2-polyprenyl-3-methyl-5-hydroxy-6-metoxy-1,4-benzoquinol methylase